MVSISKNLTHSEEPLLKVIPERLATAEYLAYLRGNLKLCSCKMPLS